MKLELQRNRLRIYGKLPDRALVTSIPGVDLDKAGTLATGSQHGLLAAMAQVEGRPMDGLPSWTYGKDSVVASEFMPHQLQGMPFMANRLEQGVYNNDDVGLGKTIQAIGTVRSMDQHLKVVLCPAFLRSQWRKEIERWAPGQDVVTLVPVSQRRKKNPAHRWRMPAKGGWVIAYYDNAEEIAKVCQASKTPYILIIDELHRLRGRWAKRTEGLQGLATFAAGRIGLTASPLYNDVDKMWVPFNLIEPGGWGTYWQFAIRYAGATEGEWGYKVGNKPTHVDELAARLSHVSIRRTIDMVADSLPYSALYSVQWLDAEVGRVNAENAYSEAAFAKEVAVADVVQNDGLPCLVFTYLRAQAHRLAAKLGGLALTGDLPAEQRMQKLANYLPTTKTPIVVGTMDAIGEGLNLQWAKAMYFAALDGQPEKVRQCIGRALRIGQVGKVPVKFFALRRSVDELYIEQLVKRLQESQDIQGKEAGKTELMEALQPKMVEDQMKEMYERYLKQEEMGQEA